MFKSPKLSLTDILGQEYTGCVAGALDALGVMKEDEAKKIADEAIDFYPEELQQKNEELLEKVGTQIAKPLADTNTGAATNAFAKATNYKAAPLTGLCNMRLGEDGRLYLLGKSEHYQSSLGHHFNGYKLIDNARKLGILNSTHNNTRGYVTRLMEQELIRTANGLEKSDKESLQKVLSSTEPKVLNRVINLETGSLAVEAGVKMMLARFYKLDESFGAPKYEKKTPVFLVMQDQDGGKGANYHGTTVITQTFRGLWPGYYEEIEKAGIYKVVTVKINDLDDFKAKMEQYNTGNYKTAGFIHEIILMNYGGVRLTEEYLQGAYALCKQYDTPTMSDEIQSCMWYKGMFLFRLYGIQPDFVSVGKGFPGGEYPASKIITTAEMDTLNQFGALVTNGQEELASLSYLITMTFAEENAEIIEENGKRFEAGMRALGEKFPKQIKKVEGQGHLSAIHFQDVETAARFAKILNGYCIDTSAQIYKVNCPPAVLLKPPVIASGKTLDYIVEKFELSLQQL